MKDLSVNQYKEMRLSGMTDRQILQALYYSPNYKRKLQRWKRENGIKLGKGKLDLLDLTEVIVYLKHHTKLETALHFGVDVTGFYKWLKEKTNETK
jgi:hypothetical protein